MDSPKLRMILLFPPHLSPNSTTLPLLIALQSLLNVSYTATYCTRPDIFGSSHIRLADPAKFADFIGADGFTIAIFAVQSDQRQRATDDNRDDGVDPKGDGELVEIVATGSVKAVDDEDVRRRAQQHAPRAGRVARERNDSGCSSEPISTNSEELDEKLQAVYRERQNPYLVHELQAFAVSPTHQGLGLGARVLNTIEWLLGSHGDEVLNFARGVNAPSFLQARLSSSWSLQNENGGRVHGVDLDEVLNLFGQNRDAGFTASEAKQLEKDAANGVATLSSSRWSHRKVVLVAIRELGNEEYYLRRGYKSLGIGILPLGTWSSNAECTTVFMEKSI